MIVSIYCVYFLNRVPYENKVSHTNESQSRAFELADMGVRSSIARLSTFPMERVGTLIDSRVDSHCAVKGGYFTVLFEDIGQNRVHIVSEGVTTTRVTRRRQIDAVLWVDNPGTFSIVSTEDLFITRGTNLDQSKIYAGRTLWFEKSGSNKNTLVGSIHYLKDYNGERGLYPPLEDWKNNNVDFVEIGGRPSGHKNFPHKELNPITLPPMDSRALNYYRSLAGDNFPAGNVLPDGFSFKKEIKPVNGSQVYYSDGSIYVEGIVYGQVIIVAKGNITVTGNLVKADPRNDPDLFLDSTSHLIGLFTGSDIIICPKDPDHNEVILESMLLAPEGAIRAGDNPDAKSFTFKGSIFTGKGIFMNPPYQERNYSHDLELIEYPLPYMPWIVEVLYQR